MRASIALALVAALCGCGSDSTRVAQLEQRVAELEARLSAERPTKELRGDHLWFQFGGENPTAWWEVTRDGNKIVEHGFYNGFGEQGYFDHGKRVGIWSESLGESFEGIPGRRIVYELAVGEYRDGQRVGTWNIYADRKGEQMIGSLVYANGRVSAVNDPQGAVLWKR